MRWYTRGGAMAFVVFVAIGLIILVARLVFWIFGWAWPS